MEYILIIEMMEIENHIFIKIKTRTKNKHKSYQENFIYLRRRRITPVRSDAKQTATAERGSDGSS